MTLKTKEQIEIMAEGGKKLAQVLVALKQAAQIDVTTVALDRIAYQLIKGAGAEPAFLNYQPAGAMRAYPYSLCASVNDVVVHGQPSKYVLQDGDVLKLDLGLKYQGFYLDAAITVIVGNGSVVAKKLSAATEEALYAGIKEAKMGKTLGDVGAAIQKVVERNKFSVVEGLTGHGIGESLHEEPTVFNTGRKGMGDALVPGMVIAIEPMVAAGAAGILQLEDESYGTADRSLSAHFEHTVAITEKGPKILTQGN